MTSAREPHRRSGSPTLVAMVMAAGIVQLPAAAIVVALPVIHREFGTSITELQWTVTAFLIPFTALPVTAGRVADVLGRRRILLAGAALFATGSALSALSSDSPLLILGLAIAGAGGAAMMPTSLSILTDLYVDAQRATAIGLWSASTELVSAMGILVGGVLTGALSWRLIFVGCIACTAVVVGLTVTRTPESRDPAASRPIDVAGALLSTAALVLLTLALVQGAAWGWRTPVILGLLAAAGILAVSFFVTERRAAHPLIDLSLFRRRNFVGSTITVFVLDFTLGAVLFFLPLYFQEILGYSPTGVGVLLLPMTVLTVVGSPLGGAIAARVGPRPPIAVGLALMAAGAFFISRLSLSTTYGDLWVPITVMGFGIGLALTPMNLAAMNAVPKDHAGSASGILATVNGLGATLGVVVTGGVFNELFARRTVGLAADAGVTLSRSQAQELDGVLAGSTDASQALDRIARDEAPGVEQAIREAFVSALGTAFLVATVLVLVGLALALVLLRNTTPADAAPSEPVLGSPTPRPAPRLGAPGG